MSGSPLSVPAIEAMGAGSLGLWRQAQEQMAAPLAPAHAAAETREDPVPVATPAPVAPELAATPMRLSELRLGALPSGLAWPPPKGPAEREAAHRQQEPDPDGGHEPAGDARQTDRREALDADTDHGTSSGPRPRAAEADWLQRLARRWARSPGADARAALETAFAQWTAGRQVLVLCGMAEPAREGESAAPDADPANAGAPAWAALVTGRRGPQGLVLAGARWPARMYWVGEPPAASAWLQARAVKAAESGQGWQLRPSPGPGETRASVAVQIGPVLEGERRWERLGVRLDRGAAFRSALGHQWSLWLLASRGCWMDD